jgi:hypothetical protein
VIEDFVDYVGKGRICMQEVDEYWLLGKCIAELDSLEVFVIADEDAFDREGYISGFYEEISASRSIKHLQYSNCDMTDDYGLCVLPTESLVSLEVINCTLSDNCICDGFSHCENLRTIEFRNCIFVDGNYGVSMLISEFNNNNSLDVIFVDCVYHKDNVKFSIGYSKHSQNS